MGGYNLCCAQAQPGSAPDIQGQDRANPTSMVLSVAMLLKWIGEHNKSDKLSRAGEAMDGAVDKVLANPGTRTRDLGGALGCKAFGAKVAEVVGNA